MSCHANIKVATVGASKFNMSDESIGRRGKPNTKLCLFISNLSIRCKLFDILSLIRASPKSIELKFNSNTPGFCVVSFGSETEVNEVLTSLQGKAIHGRKLRFNLSFVACVDLF